MLWRRRLSLDSWVLDIIAVCCLGGSLAFGGGQVGSSVGQAVQFGRSKSSQDGELALCVFVVDLHHTTDKKLLLFGSASLPVVWLADGDHESLVPGPLLLLLILCGLGLHMHKVLNRRQILHGPSLSNGEGAIGVLSRLVQLDPARVPHRDHDDAAFLVRRDRGGRRRRLGVAGVLCNAYVGDVRLLQLALVVDLGEAALGDAAALVIEALGARHARGSA